MSIAEKLQTIAQNEQKVFDAGKQVEYDAFWDSFQQNGNRTSYLYSFCGGGWTQQNLVPKYKCVPTVASSMFQLCGYQNDQGVIDFREIADKFDFSKATNGNAIFYSACVDYITADFSSASDLSNAFFGGWTSKTTTITIKVTPVTINVSGMFSYASALKNLTFTEDSEIACNGLNLAACTILTKESIVSVVNALSPNTSGLTVHFASNAVNTAFTTEEWDALKATKPNWEIAHY